MVLTYPPTAPELVCWQWVPLETLPGDNPLLVTMLPTLKALAKKAGITIDIPYSIGLPE